MPGGKKNTPKLRIASALQVALLLTQFILLKVGRTPLYIVYAIWLIIDNLLKIFIKQIVILRSGATKDLARKVTVPRYHHPHSRPKKKWFLQRYLSKLRLYVKKKVSRKLKFAVGLSIILVLLYLYTSFMFNTAYQLPSPTKLVSTNKALTTEFYDRNGVLLYRLYEGRNRSLVSLDELPKHLIDATIATEDKNFYHHPGIDPTAIARAVISNFKKRPGIDQLEGASTITQQLIKNTLLTPEKSYPRKIKEIILAIWAERLYTKDQILQMYFNEAPYGGPAWGIEAASLTYFGKSSKDLSLAQAAFLAGLPASPTQFSPYGTNPEFGKVRQKEVLRRMVENKFITQYQADLASSEDIELKPPVNNIFAPHFVMYVKDLLSQKYGQRVVSQGGLKITTTLDLNLQDQVEQIVSEEASKLTSLSVKNAAAMVTDAKTGQILAMVGSKDYHEDGFGSYNVTLALRQPGSSIKVATYATAFKQGFSPGNTILDAPVTFKDGSNKPYSPVNYDGSYHGAVSIRTAFASSYNVPAVKMLATVGIPDMIKTATDMGITTFNQPERYGLSLTLGGGEVKMIDMMTLYGTLSQMGEKSIAKPILKVVDSDGNTLEEYENKPIQAISPEIAYIITDILSDNRARTPAFGVNSLLNVDGNKVAVKTGTSDNKRDNWTFGYTPDFVVGVWVGNNDNSPMNPVLTSGVTGAAPIWNKITKALLEIMPSEGFRRPPGVVETLVDGRKDLTVSGNVPKSLVKVVKDGDKLTFSDPYSTLSTPSAQAANTINSTN